jgi:hypothetical protein
LIPLQHQKKKEPALRVSFHYCLHNLQIDIGDGILNPTLQPLHLHISWQRT